MTSVAVTRAQPTPLVQEIVKQLGGHSPVKKLRASKFTPVEPTLQLSYTASRRLKAERDERMDITRVLTPVKTGFGGFTRPPDLIIARRFAGGAYALGGRVLEQPPPHAYEPHTFFLLQTRYDVRFPQGRVESPEYIYGVCREHDLLQILQRYNSKKAPASTLLTMDNIRWPWGKSRNEFDGHDPESETVPRSEYITTLQVTPVWIPMLTVTVATRPLALTISRLCNSLAMGTPFYAAIDSHDRKCRKSFPARIRSMRLRRVMDVILDLAAVLNGARGGIPGIRWHHEDEGRCVDGAGLEFPTPEDKRAIQVGIGSSLPEWMRQEWSELLAERTEREVPGKNPFIMFEVDDFGTRRRWGTEEEVPWCKASAEHMAVDRLLQEPWYREVTALKKADALFLRAAQAFAEPRSQRRNAFDEDDESDQEEEALEDAEDEAQSKLHLQMFIHNSDNAMKQAQKMVETINLSELMPTEELDLPFPFAIVLIPENGIEGATPVYAPLDPETGEMADLGRLEEMGITRRIPVGMARKFVKRRQELWALRKRDELVMMKIGYSSSVHYPNRLFPAT
ncbi:Histone H4 [Mycena kentingensis (nom. inval.)]|nr:Histone H4 [Mycena kentingensis (nom. inval.)]